VEKLEFEKDVHADEVRLTESEIQLQYDKMDADTKESIRNRALAYAQLQQEADQWNDQKKLMADELGLERDKLNRSASLDQIEQAYAAAELGDFSYLRKLGVDTSTMEALWAAEMNETLNPKKEDLQTEDDIPEGVVDVYVGQTGNTFGSSRGRPSKKADGTWDMNVLLAKEKEGRPLSDEEKAALAAYHKTMGHIK
jgi:hypothetical protein